LMPWPYHIAPNGNLHTEYRNRSIRAEGLVMPKT